MPALLLRAIVTGFGYKIGAELGRFVADKVGLSKKEDKKKPDEDTGYPTGMEGRPDQDPSDPDEDAEAEAEAEAEEDAA